MGVTIDKAMKFMDHVKRCTDKATAKVAAVGRILPNVGGPKEPRRKIIASVAKSIIIYGAPVWADKVGKAGKAREMLGRVQRRGRWQQSARTAGMPPMDLEAKRRERKHRIGALSLAEKRMDREAAQGNGGRLAEPMGDKHEGGMDEGTHSRNSAVDKEETRIFGLPHYTGFNKSRVLCRIPGQI